MLANRLHIGYFGASGAPETTERGGRFHDSVREGGPRLKTTWTCPRCALRTQNHTLNCPRDGAPLVTDHQGAQLAGHRLTEVVGLGEQGEVLWEIEGGAATVRLFPALANPSKLTAFNQRVLRWQSVDHLTTPGPVASGLSPWGQPFTMTPALPTQTLADCIDSQPVTEAVDIIADLLLALSRTHKRAVYHHALTPDVIGLRRDARNGALLGVHLDAFEVVPRPPIAQQIAQQLTQPTDERDPPPVTDALRYMAPELLVTGRGGPTADLYAVGALMYHMLCGRPPFEDESAATLTRAHLTRAPTPVDGHRRRPLMVPVGLIEVVNRAMRKVPSRRFDSALGMHHALCIAAGLPTHDAVTTISARPRRAPDTASPIPTLPVRATQPADRPTPDARAPQLSTRPPLRTRPMTPQPRQAVFEQPLPLEPLELSPTPRPRPTPPPARPEAAASITARPTPPPTDDHFAPIAPRQPPHLAALAVAVLVLGGLLWLGARRLNEPASAPTAPLLTQTRRVAPEVPTPGSALTAGIPAEPAPAPIVAPEAASTVGHLRISTAPESAEIRTATGALLGLSDWEGDLKAGRHTLELKLAGHRSRHVEIQVIAGQTTTQHVELFRSQHRRPVALSVRRAPAPHPDAVAPSQADGRTEVLGQ